MRNTCDVVNDDKIRERTADAKDFDILENLPTRLSNRD
jgi:hypothetical protein